MAAYILTHSLYPELFPHNLSHQVSNFAAKGESVKSALDFRPLSWLSY